MRGDISVVWVHGMPPIIPCSIITLAGRAAQVAFESTSSVTESTEAYRHNGARLLINTPSSRHGNSGDRPMCEEERRYGVERRR